MGAGAVDAYNMAAKNVFFAGRWAGGRAREQLDENALLQPLFEESEVVHHHCSSVFKKGSRSTDHLHAGCYATLQLLVDLLARHAQERAAAAAAPVARVARGGRGARALRQFAIGSSRSR